jgi:hypothetical protein
MAITGSHFMFQVRVILTKKKKKRKLEYVAKLEGFETAITVNVSKPDFASLVLKRQPNPQMRSNQRVQMRD